MTTHITLTLPPHSPLAQTGWTVAERPGYFGRHRAEKHAEFDARYGPNGWRLVWVFGDQVLDREGMSLVYEDAYVAYLSSHPGHLNELCRDSREVYDDATTNVASGYDYAIQETPRTHVQDIAIRRALRRLGRVFAGSELIQIRHSDGTHQLSMVLSPGKVPFHRPELILNPHEAGWWDAGSVESFYQSNKLLVVRPASTDQI